jgi:hypothetical protein
MIFPLFIKGSKGQNAEESDVPIIGEIKVMWLISCLCLGNCILVTVHVRHVVKHVYNLHKAIFIGDIGCGLDDLNRSDKETRLSRACILETVHRHAETEIGKLEQTYNNVIYMTIYVQCTCTLQMACFFFVFLSHLLRQYLIMPEMDIKHKTFLVYLP